MIRRPNQSKGKGFAALLIGVGRIGTAAAQSAARRQGGGVQRGADGESGCTPCAAMARKEAAIARTKGV